MSLPLFNPFQDLIFDEQFCFLTGDLTTDKMSVFPEWLMDHFKFGSDKIEMIDKLEEFVKTHKVDIATLTMPKEKADAVANQLVSLGVHAIWNFAHVDLEVLDENVVVENVHLSDSLMQLSYNMTKNKREKETLE